MPPNWSKEVVDDNPKINFSTFPQHSEIRQKLVDDLNPLHQSSSSISSEPESTKNGIRITNMQEMYRKMVFVNFLNSMFPN